MSSHNVNCELNHALLMNHDEQFCAKNIWCQRILLSFPLGYFSLHFAFEQKIHAVARN